MSTVTLSQRAAAPADLPALLAMMADFNRLEGIEFDARRFEPALRKLIADPSLGLVCLLSAAHEQRANSGYFVLSWGYDLEWGGRGAVLTELSLTPVQRGRRLGREAMRLVEEAARAGGAGALHLAVRPEKAPARRLYESAGFADPKRLLMTKELARSSRSTL